MDILKRTVNIILLSICCLPLRTAAQEFGGNPPSLKFYQYNSDTARVIFPRGLERQALDVQRIVSRLAATTAPTIGKKVRKIDIVMQNQTTISNGYVALGPYRSEFYLTPNQNNFELGSLPWYKMLALHEYRHVQQNNNFRVGLSRAFYILFGEEGQSLATSAVIPNWFWEGDAVFQETLLSRQGRGRIPFFFNDFRSIWSAAKSYSWMKLRNGSLRDMTPDHYRLGFMLVAYGRDTFGDTIWAKITDDAARFKGLFYPFQKSVEKHTGMSFPEFRSRAANYFQESAAPAPDDTASRVGSSHRHFAADEEFPQWADDHSIVYVRSSYRKIPAFYRRDTRSGAEVRIRTRDVSLDNYFSYRNGRIIYAAYTIDARWRWRNFSDLRMVDVQTGHQQKLTTRTKLFSPDLSDDGQRVAAVEMDPAGTNAVKILSAATGKVVSTVPNPHQFVFTYPKFFSEDSIVAPVRGRSGEMALGIFSIRTGEARWLTPFSMNLVAFPQVYHDTVTFTQSTGNHEMLYAVIGGKLLQFRPSLDNRSTGSYQLALHGDKAAFNVFTAVGYHLCITSTSFKSAGGAEPHSIDTVYNIPALKQHTDLVTDTLEGTYAVSRYPGSYRLLHFRSWRPFIDDPNYSYSVVSENILNTMRAEISATYNRNEQYKQLGASVSYAGWYPQINGGISYTFDRSGDLGNQLINWNELNANLGVSIPLGFVHGSYTTSVTGSAGLNTQQVYYTGAARKLLNDQHFIFSDLSFSFVNQQSAARQQIYPHFAQTFSLRYRSIIDHYQAHQLLLTGSIYLPGFSNNHSIVIQGAYQQRDTLQQYLFTNGFPEARGYANIDFPRMWKLGFNYHFPIAYPDWGFGNIIYVLRIRANAYYDLGEAKSLRTGIVRDFHSTGMELFADTKWWNQLPITVGIRYSRLLNSDLVGRAANQWELVLPINLLSQ